MSFWEQAGCLGPQSSPVRRRKSPGVLTSQGCITHDSLLVCSTSQAGEALEDSRAAHRTTSETAGMTENVLVGFLVCHVKGREYTVLG